MENITKETRSGTIIYKINLMQATVNEATELRVLLDEHIAAGHSKIVVDLSQCTYLNSTFIGVLVVSHKKLLERGEELRIAGPLDPAKRLFRLTGISNVLHTFESVQEAMV